MYVDVQGDYASYIAITSGLGAGTTVNYQQSGAWYSATMYVTGTVVVWAGSALPSSYTTDFPSSIAIDTPLYFQ